MYKRQAGNRAGTGTDYVVSIMDGLCYKAVQAVKEASASGIKADDSQTLPDSGGDEGQETRKEPWPTLTLQDINSGTNLPEE